MKCPKCGGENDEGSKFCKKCGVPLKSKTENRQKIIIIGLIAVIAILAIAVLNGAGFFKSDVTLQTKDFGAFTLDVPVESDFKLSQSYSQNLFVGYVNNGKYAPDAAAFQVSSNMTPEIVGSLAEFIEDDGNLKVYRNNTHETFYMVYKDANTSKFVIYGTDLDLIKKIARTYHEVDINILSENYIPKSDI